MNYDQYKSIDNQIRDFIQRLTDYKEELEELEEVAKCQNKEKEVEKFSNEQNKIQSLIQGAENEKARLNAVKLEIMAKVLLDNREKFYNELCKIRKDTDNSYAQENK